MEYKDYYAALDVPRDASQDDIQKAYRKLARKYHPDVNQTPEAEERFKEISEAYEVLKDEEKRKKYDRYGQAWKQAGSARGGGGGVPPGFEDFAFEFGSPTGASGFSSFFEMLFGGGGPFAGGGGPGGGFRDFGGAAGVSARGRDHEAAIQLDLEEAARGGERELTLTEPTTGRQRQLTVKLPKGLRPGRKVRLAGQGGPGAGEGKRGDLYLKVGLKPDSRFELDGKNLRTTIPVSPWQAALGAEIEVPTLDGSLRIKIPEGSSSGRRIRLKGKGFPATNGQPGDLFAEIRITVPEELSDEERKLYEQLAEASGASAR